MGRKTNKFIDNKAEELAKRIHKEEHLIIENKIDKDHKIKDWYYLMASGIFNHLFNKIDESFATIRLDVMSLSEEVEKLNKSMKEVSKQQKYLWQTLEEKEVNSQEVKQEV